MINPTYTRTAQQRDGNRSSRRRARQDRPRFARRTKTIMRVTAGTLVCAMLHATFAPHLPTAATLLAQPLFRDFEERARKDVDKYADRARRLNDSDAWTNYVELGVASEFIEWEEESLDQLRESLQNIEEDEALDADQKALEKDLIRAQYDAAAAGWQLDAADYVLEQRALYRVQSADLSVQAITASEYAQIIAEADASVAADTELNLAGWDATIAPGRDAFEQRFNASVANALDDVRTANTGLSGEELVLFEKALSEQAAELHAEFKLRGHFYVQQARNLYIAEKRSDDLSLRLAVDKTSAEAVGDQVIQTTLNEVSSDTTAALAEAEAGLENLLAGADFDESQFDSFTGDWESQMEAVISAGLHKWDRAEEDLFRRRLAWIEENKRNRKEGEEIWQRNHTRIKEAREKWLGELQEKIQQGYELWDEKFAEFSQSRIAAEAELNQFIAEERARRNATLAQVGDMVRGGGAALGEAKDAYYYYNSLLDELPAPLAGCASPANRDEQLYCFYRTQRDTMQASIGRFQTILAGVDTALDANMHSNENHTGFLRDVRLFAGDLPTEIAALDPSDFKNELRADMRNRGEEYLLYRADLYELSDANSLFVHDTAELFATQPFDYPGATDLAALREIILNLDAKYGDQRRELLRIIEKSRADLPDDAAILAAVKSDIQAWSALSVDENARLRQQTLDYFRDGAAGFYLSGNENDPYLMTQAEFEWELLRRERNYMAKRLRRAAEVKRYAELAETHDAGLEMAQVTIERADITKLRSDIRELHYLLIKGDLNVDPLAVSDDAVRDSEYGLALSDRGIDPAFLDEREATLNTELGILADAVGAAAPDESELNALVADIDTLLNGVAAQLPANATDAESQAARNQHRMGVVRAKLLKYRAQIQSGSATAQTLSDRWTTLRASFGVLRDEIDDLKNEYDFGGLRTELADLRLAFGDPSLQAMQGDLRLIRDDLQANATRMAAARQRLEDAKSAYRDARIDFDILNAGNSEELIRIDINNTTGELAGILNRMAEIEDIPELAGRLFDPVTAKRAAYLFEVSENARAKNDIAYTDRIFLDVQGLEAAKNRAAKLEAVLSGVAGETDPLALGDAFLNRKADLLETAAAETELKSLGPAKTAFDDLQLARDQYASVKDLLEAAKAATNPDAADLAIKTAHLEEARLAILRAIETLVPAIRGEERARREVVLHLLGTGGDDPETLYESVAADEKSFSDRGYDLSEAAGTALREFLEIHRGKSFTELLETINTQVAAANRGLRSDAQGYGVDSAGASHSAYERLVIVRDWLIRFRPNIDYVNSAPEDTPHDRRGTDEKWESLIGTARDTEEDSGFYRNFANSIPTDAGDAWVAAYRADRSALRDRLNAVLAAPDTDLQAGYSGLVPGDRDLFISYGTVVERATPSDLRKSLLRVRRAIDLDLLQLDTGFRDVFLRETAIENQRVLDHEGREYNELQRRLAVVQSERSQLQRDLDDLDAAILGETDPAAKALLEDRRVDVARRVDELNARNATIESQAEPLRDRLRQATNVLREIDTPGSSALLAASVRQIIDTERLGIDLKKWAADTVVRKRDVRESAARTLQEKLAARDYGATTKERLKAIIGFYQTDSANVIMRDSDGNALVSQEFIDLGYNNPTADLLDILSGSQTGPNLERWSDRLLRVLDNPDARAGLAPEVAAAARQLEAALADLAAARSFIQERATPADVLEDRAIADRTRANELSKKLTLLRQFEDRLREAAAEAQANQLDVSEALLGELEKLEFAFVFRLFKGYDRNGVADGIADAGLDDRARQLLTLFERLRGLRRDQAISQVADAFGENLEAHLVDHALDPIAAGTGPEAAAFFGNYDFLKATSIEAGVITIAGDADFRTKTWGYLGTLGTEARLYKSAIVSVLHSSSDEGAALKSAVLQAIDALELELEDGLAALTGEAGRRMLRDRDLQVETSVAALIADHAAANPALTASELDQLADELYVRELRRAIAVSDNADSYDADDYPEELREFVLLRQYRRAADRMTAYRDAIASDTPAVRDRALLDLRGISGDIARFFLADDFADYLGANTTADFLAAGEGGPRSVAGYVRAYYDDRQTDATLLPAGGLILRERAAHAEYLRLQTNAAAAGGLANLDESQYFADFRAYIIIAMVDDHMADNALSLTGTTREDRKSNFRADFERMLDDPEYANANGKTLRQRLLASSTIDSVFRMAFAYLEETPGHAAYLPSVLEDRRLAGTLNDPLATAASYLPSELTAKAGYAGADFRAQLAGVHSSYAAELARLETAAEFQAQLLEGRINADYQNALHATDSEFDAIIAAAGHDAVDTATRIALRTHLKAHFQAAYLEANGLDITASTVDYTRHVSAILRQDIALRELLPATADHETLEAFFRREGPRFETIENKFFYELQHGDSRLREAAKNHRGEFLRAVIERSRGASTAYYSGLTPELRGALDEFQNRLFAGGVLTGDEQQAARAAAADYERAFALRSSQELVTSGIFENLDNILMSGILRASASGGSLELAVRERRSEYLKALIEAVQVRNETRAALSAESAALLAATPGAANEIARIAQDMDPDFVKLIEREDLLINRFVERLREADQERDALMRIVNDPALLDSGARSGIRVEGKRQMKQAADGISEAGQALLLTIQDHNRIFAETQRGYQRDIAAASRLEEFARKRGDEPLASRFSNYRTYIGSERGAQQNAYDKYVLNHSQSGSTDPLLTFEDYSGGQILEADSLNLDANALFNDPEWETLLISDDVSAGTIIELGTTTGITSDDQTIRTRSVRRVSDPARRASFGNNYSEEITYTYNENLANNYLEAVSQLNAVFNSIFLGATLADKRLQKDPQKNLREDLSSKYNASAAAGVNDLDDFLAAKQNAQSRLANHDDGLLQQKRQALDATRGGFLEAAESFADAARRGQVRTMNLVSYLETVYIAVADEMEQAQGEVTGIANAGEILQQNYATANQTYVNRLNDMAAAYRGFQQANDDYETAVAVKEFAETPYLFAATTDVDVDLDKYSADARGEYEIAMAALENANERMRQAGFNVETQDRLPDFSRIVAGLESGAAYPPLNATERDRLLELRDLKHGEHAALSAAEEAELDALVLREMHERYGDLIAARADHIKHSMRMVRIHKANEVVNAEIERLRGVVQEKKKKFDREMNKRFGEYTDPEELKARNTVYMRLAGQVDAGVPNFYNEFRGWFWGMGQWAAPYADATVQAALSGGAMQITPGQIDEAQFGLGFASSQIPPGERDAIGRWLATEPPLSEFAAFRGSYFNQLVISAQTDLAYIEKGVTDTMMALQIALGTGLIALGTTLISTGVVTIAGGLAFISTGTALLATPVTASFGPPLITAGNIAIGVGSGIIAGGTAMVLGGATMIVSAITQMAAAAAKLALLQQMHWLQTGNSINAAGTDSVRAVREKQKEYEIAQAELEYFTKIPDMQTMKDRMIQYGAKHPDNDSAEALYRLTDEDLKYMFDRRNGSAVYTDSRGQALNLTAQEQTDAYDATGLQAAVEFRDGFNRLYDPSTLTSTKPGELSNGVYGDGYTRVQTVNHEGQKSYHYAKLLETSAPVTEFDVYNMGDAFASLAAHGQTLRDQRRDTYLAAGDNIAGERRFVLEERDRTFDRLFAEAAGHREGGNEYTGYRMVYEEYEANQHAIFEAELNQRVQIQLKEWQLREQELNDRFESWKTRINQVVAKGREQWGDSENRFLQKWRDWERERDTEEEQAQAKWAAATAAHTENRQKWEDRIREKIGAETAREVLSNAIDTLNAQIRVSSNSLGLNLETIDRTAKINEAIDEIRKELPSNTEKLARLNAGIEKFNTALALSELAGTKSGLGELSASYRGEMQKHVKNMKTQAKVKMFEQYRRLVEGFKLQIQDQNEAVANQTRAAAMSQGYVQAGSRFVKASTHVKTWGAVDKYVWFDTDAEIASAMSEVGFNTLGGEKLLDFLENKSDVEVESFFYTQKLAAQSVFEKLLGKAKTEEERKTGMASKNQDIIGRFAHWVGQAPDEAAHQRTQQATQAAGNSFGNDITARNIFLQTQFGAGFGELGTGSQRLSGPALGFYLQLGISDDLIQQDRARNGLIQSMQKTRNDMLREQGANLAKTFTKTVAQSVLSGAAVIGGPAGLAAAGGAAAAIYLADSTEVDPGTGRVIVHSTDRAAIGAAAAFGGAVLPGTSAGFIGSTLLSTTAAAAQYDEDGNLMHFNYETGASGATLLRSVAGTIGGGAGDAIGGLGGVALQTAIGLATERAIELNMGRQYANYAGAVQSGIQNAVMRVTGASDALAAKRARETNNTRQAAEILQGFGAFMRRANQRITGFLSGIGGAFSQDGFFEKLSNWWHDNGFRSDNDIARSIASKEVAAEAARVAAERKAKRDKLYKKYGVSSPEALEAKFKKELFRKQTSGRTDKFLKEAQEAGVLSKSMLKHVRDYREKIKNNALAKAEAQYGKNHPDVVKLRQNLEIQAARRKAIARVGNTKVLKNGVLPFLNKYVYDPFGRLLLGKGFSAEGINKAYENSPLAQKFDKRATELYQKIKADDAERVLLRKNFEPFWSQAEGGIPPFTITKFKDPKIQAQYDELNRSSQNYLLDRLNLASEVIKGIAATERQLQGIDNSKALWDLEKGGFRWNRHELNPETDTWNGTIGKKAANWGMDVIDGFAGIIVNPAHTAAVISKVLMDPNQHVAQPLGQWFSDFGKDAKAVINNPRDVAARNRLLAKSTTLGLEATLIFSGAGFAKAGKLARAGTFGNTIRGAARASRLRQLQKIRSAQAAQRAAAAELHTLGSTVDEGTRWFRTVYKRRHAQAAQNIENGFAKHSLTVQDLGKTKTFKNTMHMPRKSFNLTDIAEITKLTGREVAVFRMNGKRYIKLGGKKSISVPAEARVLLHTHPNSVLRFSRLDAKHFGLKITRGVNPQFSTLIGGPHNSWRRIQVIPEIKRKFPKFLGEHFL